MRWTKFIPFAVFAIGSLFFWWFAAQTLQNRQGPNDALALYQYSVAFVAAVMFGIFAGFALFIGAYVVHYEAKGERI